MVGENEIVQFKTCISVGVVIVSVLTAIHSLQIQRTSLLLYETYVRSESEMNWNQ